MIGRGHVRVCVAATRCGAHRLERCLRGRSRPRSSAPPGGPGSPGRRPTAHPCARRGREELRAAGAGRRGRPRVGMCSTSSAPSGQLLEMCWTDRPSPTLVQFTSRSAGSARRRRGRRARRRAARARSGVRFQTRDLGAAPRAAPSTTARALPPAPSTSAARARRGGSGSAAIRPGASVLSAWIAPVSREGQRVRGADRARARSRRRRRRARAPPPCAGSSRWRRRSPPRGSARTVSSKQLGRDGQQLVAPVVAARAPRAPRCASPASGCGATGQPRTPRRASSAQPAQHCDGSLPPSSARACACRRRRRAGTARRCARSVRAVAARLDDVVEVADLRRAAPRPCIDASPGLPIGVGGRPLARARVVRRVALRARTCVSGRVQLFAA